MSNRKIDRYRGPIRSLIQTEQEKEKNSGYFGQCIS